MKKAILFASALLVFAMAATRVSAQTTPDTTKKTTTPAAAATTTAPEAASDVVGALASNPDYSTALTAVKTAKLDSTLKTGGPYTIFAPNNAVFSNLPAGKMDSLMKDPAKLATLLKGHVVSGKYDKAGIIKALSASKDRTATLTTLDGQQLKLSLAGSKVQLTSASGSTAQISLFDLVGANGVVNGINGVLLPKP